MLTLQVNAATTAPEKDIHFLAEHLAEAAQDARYFAMPWPIGDYDDSNWKPLISIAAARSNDPFAEATGGLLTIGFSRAFGNRWAIELLAYYDHFDVSGTQINNFLTPFSLKNVPLDLPETALFSNPRGEFVHTGIGIIASHELDYGDDWRWDAIGGVLIENLKLKNYRFDFLLTGGLDTGTAGSIDYSGDTRLNYILLGLQARRQLGGHYTIIPRIILGRLPAKDNNFGARFTTQTLDLTTTSSGGSPNSIGDGFTYMGMTLRDRRTHFEIDLGAILGYQIFEIQSHEGIDSAIILSVAWRL